MTTVLERPIAGFGAQLRHWRGIRRHSQLSLSLLAEISARHLSFLESGRAKPSRDMVLRLAEALEMPKEAANQALSAAGFAPAFPALDADAPALAPVRRAVDMMLERHNPYPAIAIDRQWNVRGANMAAMHLFAHAPPPPNGSLNLVDSLIASAGLDLVANWAEVARMTIARLRSEIIALGGDAALSDRAAALETALERHGGPDDGVDYSRAVIPTVFTLAGQTLTLFSTIASFSTVQDVVASDIRVELMFPEDDATKEYFDAVSG